MPDGVSPFYDASQNIMQAYFEGKKLRQQREAETVRAQQRQQELDQSHQEFGDKLAQAGEQFKAKQQMDLAAHNLKVTLAKHAAQKAAAQGFLPVTVDQSGKPVIDFEGQQVQANTPTQLGQSALQIKMPELQAMQDQKLQLAGVNNKAALDRTVIAQTGANDRNDKTIKATAERQKEAQQFSAGQQTRAFSHAANMAALNNQYAISRIQLTDELKNARDTGSFTKEVEDAKAGKFTGETMDTLHLNDKQRTAIYQSVRMQGGNILSKKQAIDLANLSSFASLYKQIDEVRRMMAADPLNGATNPKIMDALEQIKSSAGQLATSVGNEKGSLSKADIERQFANLPKLLATNRMNERRMQVLLNYYLANKAKSLVTIDNDEQLKKIHETYKLIPDAAQALRWNAQQQKAAQPQKPSAAGPHVEAPPEYDQTVPIP